MPSFLLPDAPVRSLDAYLASETGGLGISRAQALGPEGTIAEVLASGLRGRGGGGFPTGQKWAGLAAQTSSRRFVVCNGAEGEPGTFKDRALIRAKPYQLVEGVVIAAFAVAAGGVHLPEVLLRRGDRRGHPGGAGDPGGGHLRALHGHGGGCARRVPLR